MGRIPNAARGVNTGVSILKFLVPLLNLKALQRGRISSANNSQLQCPNRMDSRFRGNDESSLRPYLQGRPLPSLGKSVLTEC